MIILGIDLSLRDNLEIIKKSMKNLKIILIFVVKKKYVRNTLFKFREILSYGKNYIQHMQSHTLSMQ